MATGTPIALRFPGQWFQAESGLHQNWMRDYDPTTGRYLQADPLGLVDGANIYGYALGNPGRYIDPRGERGVPSSTMSSSFGVARPPRGFPVRPTNPMATWPQYAPAPLDIPQPANDNVSMQCTINSCMLRTEVSYEQLLAAGTPSVSYARPGSIKGCIYRCPGGKLKMNLLSNTFTCPSTWPDFPHETFNDLTPSELLRLRGAGVRY